MKKANLFFAVMVSIFILHFSEPGWSMVGALHTAATGMDAQQKQLDSISNNIANAKTVGFKSSRVDFEDLGYQSIHDPGVNTSAATLAPVGIQRGMGVKVSGTGKNFEMGSAMQTNRPFDVMIMGTRGFLAVQRPSGDLGFTRDGSLKRDSANRLVNTNGFPLQPEILIPSEATNIVITNDGTVSFSLQDGSSSVAGQIQLYDVVNPAGMKAVGGNLFITTPSSGEAVAGIAGENGLGVIQSGALESSNVNIVEEMVQMIGSQRSYELNSRVIKTADEMLQTATQLR